MKVFHDVDFQHNKIKNADIEGLADVAISGSYTDLENTPDVPNGISLSLNTSTYEITATLKKGNTTIATSTAIDLPLETMVVSGSYDSTNKKVILTLKNGQTVEFSVADLVDGLVATSDLASVAFSGDYDDLINKPSIPDAQIPSDWNQTDNTKKDYIKNKPTIPDAQIQSDWDQSDNTKKDFIKNKPTIPAAQIQSDWSQSDNSAKDFIKNKPTIPAAQIQSDWNQTDSTAKDFVKNKPQLGTASALNVAVSGNAANNEVVKGDDSRLPKGDANTFNGTMEAGKTYRLSSALSSLTVSTIEDGYFESNLIFTVSGNSFTITLPQGTLIAGAKPDFSNGVTYIMSAYKGIVVFSVLTTFV